MRKTTIILVLILVALLIPSIWLNTRTGVYVQGEFLRRTAPGEYNSRSGWRISYDEDSGQFDATFGHKTFSASVEIEDPIVTFTFDDGTVVHGRWDNSFRLVDEEGLPLTFDDRVQIYVGDENITDHITPTSAANSFCAIAMNAEEQYGSLSLVFVGALVYLLCAAGFLWPEETHFLFVRWKYNNPELSEEGILMERIAAVVGMILSAGIMLAPLFV